MKDMEKIGNERLKELYDRVADSVLELSDDAIMAEVREDGLDPEAEAERTRQLLSRTANAFHAAKQRASSDRHLSDRRKVSNQ